MKMKISEQTNVPPYIHIDKDMHQHKHTTHGHVMPRNRCRALQPLLLEWWSQQHNMRYKIFDWHLTHIFVHPPHSMFIIRTDNIPVTKRIKEETLGDIKSLIGT